MTRVRYQADGAMHTHNCTIKQTYKNYCRPEGPESPPTLRPSACFGILVGRDYFSLGDQLVGGDYSYLGDQLVSSLGDQLEEGDYSSLGDQLKGGDYSSL